MKGLQLSKAKAKEMLNTENVILKVLFAHINTTTCGEETFINDHGRMLIQGQRNIL